MAAERRFRAMGSDAHVVVVGGDPRLVDLAVERIDLLERRWSRFLPDSEVSELNRRAGRPVRVSADTVELVTRSIEAWRLSGGVFDPTVLGDVLRAGYDRSFEQLEPTASAVHCTLAVGAADIDVTGDTVTLAPNTGFDAGGIGKGLAADLVVAELMAAGADGACVNVGGDLRVAGASPSGDGWTVAVEHPSADAPLALVGVADGAVATSTTLRRRWDVDGITRHHLIDPGTGVPSDSDLDLVTVIAARAWIAEVLATAVLLRGSRHAFDPLGGTGAEALAVSRGGSIIATDGWFAFTGGGRRVPVLMDDT